MPRAACRHRPHATSLREPTTRLRARGARRLSRRVRRSQPAPEIPPSPPRPRRAPPHPRARERQTTLAIIAAARFGPRRRASRRPPHRLARAALRRILPGDLRSTLPSIDRGEQRTENTARDAGRGGAAGSRLLANPRMSAHKIRTAHTSA